ncbi:hypothetical protein CCH79_00020781 [Gambusia affinis]|uniref:Dynein axonemal assembly factor 5 TPR repeats domain-containing protein n=1 Tax=Gambusia affinis TaxID=33528 RepID=A0A315UY34_GAMAF|nr:hypothetical protein CCH79_00020781 [Gambusia affinis]
MGAGACAGAERCVFERWRGPERLIRLYEQQRAAGPDVVWTEGGRIFGISSGGGQAGEIVAGGKAKNHHTARGRREKPVGKNPNPHREKLHGKPRRPKVFEGGAGRPDGHSYEKGLGKESALLASSLLTPLSDLMDDPSASCRTNAHRVLSGLAQLPAGAEALLSLVPKLMLKLCQLEEVRREKQEEEQELLLSTLTSCSRLDPLPALASDGVSILGQTLTHTSPSIRREAAAALMALSVPADGKQQVCDQGILSTLLALLHDRDLDVQTNAAGVIMNTVIIRPGKYLCLELGAISILLQLLSEEEDEEQKKRRKTLVIYSLRALTALSEAPEGRVILSAELPLLERRSDEQDEDVRRAAQTAIKVVTWKP